MLPGSAAHEVSQASEPTTGPNGTVNAVSAAAAAVVVTVPPPVAVSPPPPPPPPPVPVGSEVRARRSPDRPWLPHTVVGPASGPANAGSKPLESEMRIPDGTAPVAVPAV